MRGLELCFNLLLSVVACGEHLAINWTQVGTVKPGWKTHGGTPLAPCPCDLTSTACDPWCCCDEECPDSITHAPICQLDDGVMTHNCRYSDPLSLEWYGFLCPVRENTPYLGLFYPHKQNIRDLQRYLVHVAGQQPYSSYQDKGIHTPGQEYQPHYVHGAEVQVGAEAADGTVIMGVLSLPQMVLDGTCVDTFPVQFLEDFHHKCTTIMSPEKCESEAILSTARYLQSVHRVASDPIAGSQQIIEKLGGLNLVNASVEYRWMRDITGYIKVQRRDAYTPLMQSNDTYWQEGSGPPNLNTSTGRCDNVVLAVKYSLTWEGPAIVDVATTIMLGSVPVSLALPEDTCATSREHNFTCFSPPAPSFTPLSYKPQILLIQHFIVEFQHMDASINSSDPSQDLVDEEGEGGNLGLQERSGNPGYLLHRPLLAGYARYNTTLREDNSTSEDQMVSVDLSDSSGLYVWRPDADGSCLTSRFKKVMFGIDMISACHYSWSSVYSCSDLSEMLESFLLSLVQADMVSTFGWPNNTMETDFLPLVIIKQELENHTDGGDCDVPTSLEYHIIYRDVLNEPSPTLAVLQVTGASVRLHYQTFHFTEITTTGSILLTSTAVFSRHPRPSKLSRYQK